MNLLSMYDIHYSSNVKDYLQRTNILEVEVMKCSCLQCVLCKNKRADNRPEYYAKNTALDF